MPLFKGFSPLSLPGRGSSEGCYFDPLLLRSIDQQGVSRVNVVRKSRSSAQLVKQNRGDLLKLHLVGNVIPNFLPPLLMGYLLWDLSPVSEIYRELAELTEALSSLAGTVNIETTSMGQHMGEASSSIDGNRAARVLVEAAERSREEIHNKSSCRGSARGENSS